MDITALSLAQMRELMQTLPEEIERREKAERAAVRQEIEQLAREKGFELTDLISTNEEKPKRKYTVAIKYRHPNDSSLAWTGRGRQPKWVEAFIANGGTLDQLLIN